jgi:hypothetical protein
VEWNKQRRFVNFRLLRFWKLYKRNHRNQNSMKQHTGPVIIWDGKTTTLNKVSLSSKEYNEDWIQDICFNNPSLLPVEELEPAFAGMIPICRELPTPSGFIDLVYINENGFITIGECKLWRNPEARRKVIGQILDYAKDLSKWDYSKLETACLRARKETTKTLFGLLNEHYPEMEESSFIDNVQRNLEKGRFLLTVIGDGIRSNMEDLSNYLQRNGNLGFTLGLIELPVYKHPNKEELIITPRILAKTKEIERVIFTSSERDEGNNKHYEQDQSASKTISEVIFFERLEKEIGRKETIDFQSFIKELTAELNILPKLGRGKRLSLNLKSSNESYNFASIQENGEVWFYGIVNKTEEAGSKQIGIDYLTKTAKAVKGEFINTYKEWFWCVKRNDQYVNIIEYLRARDKWKEIISDTLGELNESEEAN